MRRQKRGRKTSSRGQTKRVTPTAAAPLRRPGDDAHLAACASDEPSFFAAYVVIRSCTVNYSKLASKTPKYYFINGNFGLFSSLQCHQIYISINFATQLFDSKIPPIHKLRRRGKLLTRAPPGGQGRRSRKGRVYSASDELKKSEFGHLPEGSFIYAYMAQPWISRAKVALK